MDEIIEILAHKTFPNKNTIMKRMIDFDFLLTILSQILLNKFIENSEWMYQVS